jgi:hypothetical protein
VLTNISATFACKLIAPRTYWIAKFAEIVASNELERYALVASPHRPRPIIMLDGLGRLGLLLSGTIGGISLTPASL